jgi:mono/diheme cytochrome c family protein
VRRLLAAASLALACSRPPPESSPDAGARAAAEAEDPSARLEFRVDGRTVRTLTLGELTAIVGAETVENFDGYYHRAKRFRALRLDRVLGEAFGSAVHEPLRSKQFVLRARDGYTVPISGERLLEAGAYLAVRDLDRPGWEPIGPQRANPGPAYLVWREPSQVDLETHPRPWQLAVIEVARIETVFPHTAPAGEPEGSPARAGYAIFTELCIRCHAVNREGGRVGPDLNVPLNVTEYRPEAQIRAYIRNPLTFRYGAMPAHPNLGDRDLDGLVAYLRAMAARKHDPDARPDGGAP